LAFAGDLLDASGEVSPSIAAAPALVNARRETRRFMGTLLAWIVWSNDL
jgi:hypothetical protein